MSKESNVSMHTDNYQLPNIFVNTSINRNGIQVKIFFEY